MQTYNDNYRQRDYRILRNNNKNAPMNHIHMGDLFVFCILIYSGLMCGVIIN